MTIKEIRTYSKVNSAKFMVEVQKNLNDFIITCHPEIKDYLEKQNVELVKIVSELDEALEMIKEGE